MRLKTLKLAVVAAAVLAAAVWTGSVASSSRPLPVASPILVKRALFYQADTLKRNETLSHLFGRHNIGGSELVQVVNVAEGLNPRRIRDGKVFEFRYVYGEQKPDRISVRLGDARTGDDRILTLSRDTTGIWSNTSETVFWVVDVQRAHGVVTVSLDPAVHGSIPDSILPQSQRALMINDLADNIFGWVIDFNLEFREDDEFTILYERLVSPLGDVRYGRVLAANIETGGRENSAYVMTDDRGRNTYYDEEGRSLRRSFKVRPVDYGRLSSRFSRNRFHPILKQYRPHQGIDWAAPIGTEIKATGSGTVTRAGRWGTYGVMVAIKHPYRSIETRYGHMSRLGSGIKPGVRVEEGQVIGYVGMTGLTNAPHVHYEMLQSGVHRNPRDLLAKEPGLPIPTALRPEFETTVAQYDTLLNARRPQLVSAEPDN